ncbi:hypothetical protein V6O07_05310, partial [Arthrospira platensis SPKY2]
PTFSGADTMQLETVENGICLETVKFHRVTTQMNINTGVTVEGVYHPINASSRDDLEIYYYNGYIKMNIPKLMPFFSVRAPYESQVNVNTGIIANAKDNKPRVSNKVTKCNYIRVKAPRVLLTKSGINYGESVPCIFPNKNLKNPSFLCI